MLPFSMSFMNDLRVSLCVWYSDAWCVTRRTTLLWNVTRENCVYVYIDTRAKCHQPLYHKFYFFFLDNLITTTTAKKGRNGIQNIWLLLLSHIIREQNIFDFICLQQEFFCILFLWEYPTVIWFVVEPYFFLQKTKSVFSMLSRKALFASTKQHDVC